MLGIILAISPEKTADFEIDENGVLTAYTGSGGDVTVPDGVTAIGARAFYKTGVTSVVLPAGVLSIGERAFSHCDALTTVQLPDSLTEIGVAAFSASGALSSVNLPESVTAIGRGAFTGTAIKKAKRSSGLTAIADYLFSECSKLESVVIGSDVSSVGIGAFLGCDALKEVQYAGTISTWRAIGIAEENEALTRASLTIGAGGPEVAFGDVPDGAYYKDAIDWAVALGVTNGTKAADETGPALFSPEAAVTRGQAVTFLWRARGCPEPETKENHFADVKESDYYYKAVLWAVEQDITNGTKAADDKGPALFSPKDSVKRGQMLTFLWRAGGCPEPETQLSNPFRDVEAGKYYEKAILWAVENKITNGTKWDEAKGVFEFSPSAPVKRDEMLTFLWRAMGEPGRTGDYEGKKWYSDAETWASETGLLEGLPTAYVRDDPCPRSDVVYYLFRVLASGGTELDLSAAAVYARILAMQSKYPEGMRWTNADSYTAKATLNGATYIGCGCAGFALILSDAAFGEAPIRQLNAGEFTYADLRVGDILRINGNSHSVVILEVSDSAVTVAEGNYNSSIHWGRKIARPAAEAASYVLTRYPA